MNENEYTPDLKLLQKNLIQKGYEALVFETARDAGHWLVDNLNNKSIGWAGCHTVNQLGIQEELAKNNTVLIRKFPKEGETFLDVNRDLRNVQVFILSANGVSQDGDIINIDGNGNRLASSLFGHDEVIYIIGKNKVAEDFEKAMFRARNIAAVKNNLRMKTKNPCSITQLKRLESEYEKQIPEEKRSQLAWEEFIANLSPEEMNSHCWDCKSPTRICKSFLIHAWKPNAVNATILLVNEDLGF